jgi:hypothetical protein
MGQVGSIRIRREAARCVQVGARKRTWGRGAGGLTAAKPYGLYPKGRNF